jgi:hypothetical protein
VVTQGSSIQNKLQFGDEDLSEVGLILISNLDHYRESMAQEWSRDRHQEVILSMTYCDISDADELDAAM